MTIQSLERDIVGGLEAEQRAPAPGLALPLNEHTGNGVATPMSEYASTVVDRQNTLEKTGSAHSHDHDAKSDKAPADTSAEDQAQADAASGILTGIKLYLVFLSLMLAVFVSCSCRLLVPALNSALDVCARPVDCRYRHPRYCFRLSSIRQGRLDHYCLLL